MAGRSEKGRRSHAFGGCATCRRRHVKCDQLRPVCLTCTALGVTCEGFSTQLKWMAASDDYRRSKNVNTEDGAEQVTRRHLYTERSRRAMSNALQQDLTSKSVDSLLTELDAKSREVAESTAGSVVVGPFGILDFQSMNVPPEIECSAIPSDMMPRTEDLTGVFGETSPHTAESTDSLNNMDEFLNWSDLFELDFSTTDTLQSNLDEFPLPPPPYEVNTDVIDNIPPKKDILDSIPSDRNRESCSRKVDASHISAAPPGSPSIPCDLDTPDAQLLLRHFQDLTISQMSSLPPSPKAPWSVLTVPCAVHTLAQVTFLSTSNASHAALSNLLAVLAISAKHMTNQPGLEQEQVDRWRQFSLVTINQAKEHLQWSLQNETQGKFKAKYKDQLMAILAMMAYAVTYDRQEDARCYMLDAERLLRLRGLAKRTISRKARMLHHLYTWFRIVGESTYVLRDYTSDVTQAATRVQQTSGPNARLDDFLRLEQNISDSEMGTRGQKEQRAGLRDIHLEDSREWSSTMYLQLYGISETWLSLVSQTTRLSNVMDSMKVSRKKREGKLLESVQRRTERLENMICSYAFTNKPPPATQSAAGGSEEERRGRCQSCMVRALNSALVIFFYRRIRNVNPWILQQHVNDVLEALKEFDSALRQAGLDLPGSPWPAFMAGCEATGKDQQDYLLRWVERAHHMTGFSRFQPIKDMMLEVWRRRDDSRSGKGKKSGVSSTDSGWVQISKEKQMYIMLS